LLSIVSLRATLADTPYLPIGSCLRLRCSDAARQRKRRSGEFPQSVVGGDEVWVVQMQRDHGVSVKPVELHALADAQMEWNIVRLRETASSVNPIPLSDLRPDDLVFGAPRGGVLRSGSFRRGTWNRACVAVGLGELVTAAGKPRYRGLVPHELRHTAASLAIDSGASVKSVQAMLGHASATLTLDRYGHLFGDELDALAGRLDAAARSAAASPRPRRRGNVIALHAAGL